jgi:hypothetical protein
MARGVILQIVALAVVAGAFGLWLGVRAIPPDETAIIEAQAARYVAQTGRAATDCAARPSPITGVRLVVTCGSDWAVAVDRWGRPVPMPDPGPGL